MNSHMNFIKEQLYTLTSIPSPSSFTTKVTDYLLSELSSLGYSPERSNKGNVFVTLGGSGSPLVLAAHVDTLGAMVRSIKENGRLRPTTIGGHQWSTADGENCTSGFLTDGDVPMDNNASERAIRGFCVGKKNWQMIDTINGAKSSAIIYSIAETAKANHLKPYEYFEYSDRDSETPG